MKNSNAPAEQLAAFPTALTMGPGTSVAPYEAEEEGGEAPPPEQHAKLKRYWAAIKRFRWLVLALAAAGTIAGVIATRFIDPVFAAQGAVWVADVDNGNSGGAYRPPNLLPNGSWVQLVKNFAVIDSVVAKERLFLQPKSWEDSLALQGLMPTRRTAAGKYTLTVDSASGRYTLAEATQGVIERGVLGDSVGKKAGIAWVPTLASLHGMKQVHWTMEQPRSVSVGLEKRLDVSMSPNSNFIVLSLTGPDKWQTADLLNVWMQQFVSTAAQLRKQTLLQQADILDAQRTSAHDQLTDAESALQAFQTNSITKPTLAPTAVAAGTTPTPGLPQGTPPSALNDRYFGGQIALQQIQRDRQALQEIANSARQGTLNADALAQVPVVAAAPELSAAIKELVDNQTKLRDVQQTYTDSFPAVRRLAAAIQTLKTRTIPMLATQQADLLGQRATQLSTDLSSDASQLKGIPSRAIEQMRLQRNLATAEGLYSNVENRYETAHLGAESTVPDVTILDPALPSAAPLRNTKVLLVLGGFLAAAGLGALIAILLDLADRKFRYPEQIGDDLGMNVLGAVPEVPSGAQGAQDPEALLQSVEAFRGLRMTLHHAFAAPPVMLTISSPGVGDGKSMISANLALSFADAGYKTLLIDGDIRRGKLHTVLGVQRRPGLLDYLNGHADAVAVMQSVPAHGRLTLIASGTRRHRGPELLTSARLPQLLQMARTMFDVVIVDSAPLAAGIDAYALGVATGSMVLVMRTGHTDRRVAKAKVHFLRRFPIRIIGAVVNAVPPGDLSTEYSYLYNYAPDTESDIVEAGDEIAILAPGEVVETAP